MHRLSRPVFWVDRQREECYVHNIRPVPGAPQHHHDQCDMCRHDSEGYSHPAQIQCVLVQRGNARHLLSTLPLSNLLLEGCAQTKFT